MKTLWCWRCRKRMPMLEETEFLELENLFAQCVLSLKELRSSLGVALNAEQYRKGMDPVLRWYFERTGATGVDANEIRNHRISLYGSPCPQCKKELRTPAARHCLECGFRAKS